MNIVLSDIEFQDRIILKLGDSTSEDFFNGEYMDKHKLKELMMMIEYTDCEFYVLSHSEPLKREELQGYLSGILEN